MTTETVNPNENAPAKNNKPGYLKDAGFYFILWGILVIIYCLLVYNATSQGGTPKSWYYTLFAIGGVISLLYSRRKDNASARVSWPEKLYGYTWAATAVILVAIWLTGAFFSAKLLVPLSLLVYGIAALITGGYTKYWPSIIGAVICLACALFSFTKDFPTQHLIAAIAIFFVHVLPGVLMRR